MRVTVHLPEVLRARAGGTARLEVELNGSTTLDDLLDELAASHPAVERQLRDESRTLRRYVNFYLAGEECRALDGAATVLTDGQEVRVVPSVAGG